MKLRRAAPIAAFFLAAAPAIAQNTVAPAPAPAPAPPAKVEPVPAPAPAANSTAPVEPAPVQPAPAPQPAPMQTIPIQPDAQYPNGFQDPDDPFANELRAYRAEQEGFPWGLLGLLGLLGLIPLIRGNGAVRTVYVERDEPRRVVREEDRP